MMYLKSYRRKWSWPILRQGLLIQHLIIWNNESTKNVSQGSRSPGLDLNPDPPENEAELLITRPRCSAKRKCSRITDFIVSFLHQNRHWTRILGQLHSLPISTTNRIRSILIVSTILLLGLQEVKTRIKPYLKWSSLFCIVSLSSTG